MDILANENVPKVVVDVLRQQGHDVAWVRTYAPGSGDTDVLDRARTEGRILLTFDKDFGELAFRLGLSSPSGIILLRIRHSPPGRLAELVAGALQARTDWAGHFSVVEADRVRMMGLPD